MREFIIDRLTWLRGEGEENSFLLRKDEKMCCFGQIGKACGLTDKNLLNAKSLYYAHDRDLVNADIPSQFFEEGKDSNMTVHIMEANDDKGYSEKYREKEIKRLFKKIDIKIKFIN